MADATHHAGTSGYSYKEWKGSFYPEKLPQKEFLDYYASRLNTVEVNNSFYRFPAASLFEGWRDKTPEGFCFAVKANQGITHRGRLKDVTELTVDFVERCRVLGPKLGPILFQLPPNFKRDDERLQDFLRILPGGERYTLEFRHTSWFDPDVYEMLRGAGVALCLSEGEKLDTPKEVTADFCYLRLRKEDYTDAELTSWREWIDGQRSAGRPVYTYLKHDDEGASPERALQLLGAAGESRESQNG